MEEFKIEDIEIFITSLLKDCGKLQSFYDKYESQVQKLTNKFDQKRLELQIDIEDCQVTLGKYYGKLETLKEELENLDKRIIVLKEQESNSNNKNEQEAQKHDYKSPLQKLELQKTQLSSEKREQELLLQDLSIQLEICQQKEYKILQEERQVEIAKKIVKKREYLNKLKDNQNKIEQSIEFLYSDEPQKMEKYLQRIELFDSESEISQSKKTVDKLDNDILDLKINKTILKKSILDIESKIKLAKSVFETHQKSIGPTNNHKDKQEMEMEAEIDLENETTNKNNVASDLYYTEENNKLETELKNKQEILIKLEEGIVVYRFKISKMRSEFLEVIRAGGKCGICLNSVQNSQITLIENQNPNFEGNNSQLRYMISEQKRTSQEIEELKIKMNNNTTFLEAIKSIKELKIKKNEAIKDADYKETQIKSLNWDKSQLNERLSAWQKIQQIQINICHLQKEQKQLSNEIENLYMNEKTSVLYLGSDLDIQLDKMSVEEARQYIDGYNIQKVAFSREEFTKIKNNIQDSKVLIGNLSTTIENIDEQIIQTEKNLIIAPDNYDLKYTNKNEKNIRLKNLRETMLRQEQDLVKSRDQIKNQIRLLKYQEQKFFKTENSKISKKVFKFNEFKSIYQQWTAYSQEDRETSKQAEIKLESVVKDKIISTEKIDEINIMQDEDKKMIIGYLQMLQRMESIKTQKDSLKSMKLSIIQLENRIKKDEKDIDEYNKEHEYWAQMTGKDTRMKKDAKQQAYSLKKRQQAEKIYYETLVEYEIQKSTLNDLELYIQSLEDSLHSYHLTKIEQVNHTICSLWDRLYKGKDLESIMILPEDDKASQYERGGGENNFSSRKNLRYKVVYTQR